MLISKKLLFFLFVSAICVASLLSLSFKGNGKNVRKEFSSLPSEENKVADISLLVNDLHNGNSLKRRDAIIMLGNRQAKTAILPLFSMLMDSNTSSIESKLIAKSLYSITEGKILEYIIPLLDKASITGTKIGLKSKAKSNDNKTSNNKEQSPLKDKQILYLLEILSMSSKEEIEKGNYNLAFLGRFLDSNNNALVLGTLNCISVLLYEPLYSKIQTLYDKDLYFKISVIQILTKIGLNSVKYYNSTINFIESKIPQEEHPSVQEENYLALYMLNQHLLSVPPETENFMQHIVGLNSNTLDISLAQEYYLLNKAIPLEEISLIKFFLSDFVSPRIRARLLNILLLQNKTSFLEDGTLLKNIRERYLDTKGESAYWELAKTSLKIMGERVSKKEDIISIVNYFNETKLKYTIVSIINDMLNIKAKKELLKENSRLILDFSYTNLPLMSWFSYIAYSLDGEDGLEKQLNRSEPKKQIAIFHDLSLCGISSSDKEKLINLYGNKGEDFQKVLTAIGEGSNLCYFV